MKDQRITSTIIVLVLSMALGFILLYFVGQPNRWLAVAIGTLVVVLSVLLIIFARRFDNRL